MPDAEPKPLANTLWIVGGRVASMVVTIGVIGAVARHLGPDGFGQLNTVLAILAIAAPWASLSLDAVVVRELVRHPEQAGNILGTACLLRIAAGLTAILGVIAVGWFALPDQWLLLTIGSASLVFQSAAVIDLWFQRHLASRRSVISRTIVIYAGAAVKLLLVVFDAPLIAFVGTIVLEAVLYAAGFLIAYRTSTQRSGPWCWDGGLARRFLWQAMPLAAASLVSGLGHRYDQVIVAVKLSDTDAGLYLAANRFTEFALFAAAALIASLFPALTAARDSRVEFERRLGGLFDSIGALGWATAIGFTLFAAIVVQVVLGPQFDGATPALIARGWMGLFVLSGMVLWHAVLLTTSAWWNLAGALVAVAVQVALAPAWLDRWGMLGAAYAMGAGAFTGGVVMTWVVPALRPLAAAQLRGLLIVARPGHWRALLGSLTK